MLMDNYLTCFTVDFSEACVNTWAEEQRNIRPYEGVHKPEEVKYDVGHTSQRETSLSHDVDGTGSQHVCVTLSYVTQGKKRAD